MFVFWPDEENGSLSLYPVHNPTIPPGVHVFIRNGPLFPAQNVCEKKTPYKKRPGVESGRFVGFPVHIAYAVCSLSCVCFTDTKPIGLTRFERRYSQTP